MSPCSRTTLPTFDNLGATPPQDVDAGQIGRAWVEHFSHLAGANDIDSILRELLHSDPWWRDLFALTWDIRTFHGPEKLARFLRDRLAETGFTKIVFLQAAYESVFPDLAWIVLHFSFETDVASCSGVARLVYEADGVWRAVVIGTNMEDLKEFPESLDTSVVSPQRNETRFKARDPEVLILGGGQNGLAVAARLKHLGVSCLIVEKNGCIGDNWRNQYESLKLHGPTSSHMPYIHFPESFPVFPTAVQFGDWLEFYANALDLDVWTSSSASSARRNDTTGKWDVVVNRGGTEVVLHVDHLILAGGFPFKYPKFGGEEIFTGRIMSSSNYRSARDFVGQKVVVVGACSAGHDIASDCAGLGIDVTIVQRSSTYVFSIENGVLPAKTSVTKFTIEEFDRRENSLPVEFMKPVAQRRAVELYKADRIMLEALEKTGYTLLHHGIEGAGALFHLLRGGGHYLDNGACKQIIEKKIKVKSGVLIERLTDSSVRFEDGDEIKADVIILATGFEDARLPLRQLLGDDLGSRVPPIWGLNQEGELQSVWRELEPAPNLWPVHGNLHWNRFFSKHVAMQIKAKQEGLLGARYAASPVA